MKLLFISNIAAYKVGSFSMASIMAAKVMGMDFHLAANFKNSNSEQMQKDEKEYGICLHQIDFHRNPLSIANIKAYRQLCELIKEEQIDVIHCNTPIGGILGRIAGTKYKVKSIIYQVHGFHFYKGAPAINWLFFYPVERLLALLTNAIITINKEDYTRAKHFKLKSKGNVYYVPGVGIDLDNYSCADKNNIRAEKRKELKIESDDVVIVSVGELNKNKNNTIVLDAISQIENSKIKYCICGVGEEEENLRKQVHDLNLEDRVLFLGYRKDVIDILFASDIFIMSSFREGLSRSIMEAKAAGLICIVSDIRGNRDLIDRSELGFLCNPKDSNAFANAIEKAISNGFSNSNIEDIKKYELKKVVEDISTIYKNEFYRGQNCKYNHT